MNQCEVLKKRIADFYGSELRNHVAVPFVDGDAQSAWAQYTIRVPMDRREALAAELKTSGIPTQIYYPRPLHHQPAYRDFPVAVGGVSVAERLPQEVLSLPMHPYLDPNEQLRVVSAVRRALES